MKGFCPCKVLVGNLRNPCGILVGSLWDSGGIWETTSFPDNCFPNIVSRPQIVSPLRPFATFWHGEERPGNNYLGKKLFPQSPPNPTRIQQGSRKDFANSQQEPYKDFLQDFVCFWVLLQKFAEIPVELLGNPCWENCFPGPLLSLPHFS